MTDRQPNNRIVRAFEHLRHTGRKGLVGYMTAGDPDEATSEKNILDALAAGLDVLELGVPFSDPTADGPTIQEAARRALAAGMTVARVLAMVRRIRKETETPIILFGYANPFLKYGYDKLCADAAAAGVDGLLIVDLPFEESKEIRPAMKRNGLILVPLIAPTTPPERAAAVLADAEGFVYYIMVRGVTGARSKLAGDLDGNLAKLRAVTRLTIAAGFGIASGAQARKAAACADAVVVGSALVRAATEGRARELVGELRSALG
jgi:tryptophan synthase alpha chain